jgi:hypothetical protein
MPVFADLSCVVRSERVESEGVCGTCMLRHFMSEVDALGDELEEWEGKRRAREW